MIKMVKVNYIPDYISISEPIAYTYPVLIMRKKDKAYDTLPHIVNISAKYYIKLDFSSLEDPSSWKVQHNPDMAIEDLMDMLVDKTIDYAVCNYNEAITLMPFYAAKNFVIKVAADKKAKEAVME